MEDQSEITPVEVTSSADLSEGQLAQMLADKKKEKAQSFINDYNALCQKYGLHVEHNVVWNYGQAPQKQVVIAEN